MQYRHASVFRSANVLLFLFLFSGVPCSAAEKAKNVILFIGDGMGFNCDLAGTYFRYGEAGKQPYHAFPVHVACATFARAQAEKEIPAGVKGYDPAVFWESLAHGTQGTEFTTTTDSAAASTALHGGVKTVRRRIGFDADMKPIELVSAIAAGQGKKVGSVTSVPLSHATPAGFAAHSTTRYEFEDIFLEMTAGNSPLSVVMGAGHPLYEKGLPKEPETKKKERKKQFQWVGGEKTWQAMRSGQWNGFSVIERKERFLELASAPRGGETTLPKKVIGLARSLGDLPPVDAAPDDCPETKALLKKSYRKTDWDALPSLATMSLAALNVLSHDNENGFLVMIEGGAIDHANHARKAGESVLEHAAFSKAIEAVIDWVEKNSSWDETLMIVTSDHETGQIWGPETYEDDNENGVFDEGDRFNGFQPIENRGRGKVPGLQYASGSHSNALVPLWAKGPGSRLFLERIKGVDEKAAAFWNFSGKYVDNTDVFFVIRSAMTP